MKKQVCTLVGLTGYDGYQLAAYFAKRGFEIAVICKPGRLFENFKQYFATQGINFHSFHVNTDQPSYIENAVRRVRQSIGETDVLIYNDTIFGREMNYPKYGNAQDIRLNSDAALRAVNEVSPYMARSQKGMIFFCGQEFMPNFGSNQNQSTYTHVAKWLSMKVSAELESRNIRVYSVYQQSTVRVYNYTSGSNRYQENQERIRKSKTVYVYDNEKFYLNENWLNHNQFSANEMYPTYNQQENMSGYQQQHYGYNQGFYPQQQNHMQSNYNQHDEMYWNSRNNWQYNNMMMYGNYSPYNSFGHDQNYQWQQNSPWQGQSNWMNPYQNYSPYNNNFGYNQNNFQWQQGSPWQNSGNWMNPYQAFQSNDWSHENGNRRQYRRDYPQYQNQFGSPYQYGRNDFEDVESYWHKNFKSNKNKQHSNAFGNQFEDNFMNWDNEMFEESISYS